MDGSIGKKKMLIEIDEDDINIINESIRMMEQNATFDRDDQKLLARLKHVKEISHQIWTKLHPS